MDKVTLALANAYTDSQRLAYEEKKSITLMRGSAEITAPFTELIGLEVVDKLRGRCFLSAQQDKPSKEGLLLNYNNSAIIFSYGNADGMLSEPCLLLSGLLMSLCPLFFADGKYQALIYAFEEVTDTFGLGVTFAKGWHAINTTTFANEPFDPETYPFMATLDIIKEATTADTVEYVTGMFTLRETISYTVKSENIFDSGGTVYVTYIPASTTTLAMTYESFELYRKMLHPSFMNDEVTITYTETIHPIDPKYLPEGGVGYSETGDIFFDGALEIIDDGITGAELTYNEEFNVGNEYTVKLDSCEYRFECKQTLDDEGGVVNYIGNEALLHGDLFTAPITGGSFVAATLTIDGPIALLIIDRSGSAHATIASEKIHTIDPKYLPSGSGGGLPVVELSGNIAFSEEATALSEENCAKLNAVASSKLPAVIVINGGAVAFVCSYMNEGGPIFVATVGGGTYYFMGDDEGNWNIMVATT